MKSEEYKLVMRLRKLSAQKNKEEKKNIFHSYSYIKL